MALRMNTHASLLFIFAAAHAVVGCSCTQTGQGSEPVSIVSLSPADPLEPSPALPLTEAQKRALAQYIVCAQDWALATKELHTHAQRGPQHLAQIPSLILFDDDSYLTHVIIPYVKQKCTDSAESALYTDALHALAADDIFDFVAQYYIADHAEDANAWAFLWFFAHMQEEEAPYCRFIKDAIRQRGLDATPYGKQILTLLGTQEFRPNDGRCLE